MSFIEEIENLSTKAQNLEPEARHQNDLNKGVVAASYCKLRDNFDQLELNTFQGCEMEKLVEAFLNEHKELFNCLELEFPNDIKRLLKTQTGLQTQNFKQKLNELLQDDLRVLNLVECDKDTEEKFEGDLFGRTNFEQVPNKALSDIYRRACEACYLRVTFNKSRLKQEDDRRDPVRWAQLAIRHNPNNFKSCFWYMIAVGRYSETIVNPKDRTLAGEAFKRAILRCLKLEPNDPLSHHLLGRYYYHVGNLNWIQRTIVKSFFNFKVEGSYEDAEREFRIAHSLKSDWLPNGLWMARVLEVQGKPKDEIKHWIETALKLDVREPTTEIEYEELFEMGKRLKLIEI